MPAYDTIAGFVTAPGAAPQNWTMNVGDSLRLRNTPGNPWLLDLWTDVVAPGNVVITSPMLHDLAQALSFNALGNGDPLRNNRKMEKLYPNDLLTVTQTGSAGVADIDSGTLCIYYDTLPGLEQNLITLKEFLRRYVRQFSGGANVTPIMTGGYGPAAAGGPGGGSNFRGNTEYAVMGYTQNDLPVGTITFAGPDTRNLRIPLPQCGNRQQETAEWFLKLAAQFPDLPMIPVINSDNAFAIQIESVHSSVILPAGTAQFQLAQLS